MDSQFNQIGYVSTEGGPLLVGDYEPLTKWNGIETEDYDNLLKMYQTEEDFIYSVAERKIVVFKPEGGAIISVHKDSGNNFVFVRSFEDICNNDKYIDCVGQSKTILGQIEIYSGVILVISATESGVLLDPLQCKENISGSFVKEPEMTRPTGGLAFDDSVLAIPIPNGIYECISDFVFGTDDKLYQAKRLLLTYRVE